MAVSLNTRTLPKSRAHLEELIEAAIARLDDMDPDPDLEPSIAVSSWVPAAYDRKLRHLQHLDLEEVSEDEGSYDTDLEPSLGAPEANFTCYSPSVEAMIRNRRRPDLRSELDRTSETFQFAWSNPSWDIDVELDTADAEHDADAVETGFTWRDGCVLKGQL